MGQSQSQTNHQYESLPPTDRYVRLLTLEPATYKNAPIVCHVERHSLNWDPLYEALSYTWGDPKDICPTPIGFGGYPRIISANLEEALRVLRFRDKPRVLWIDALCINQSDVHEKAMQVAMMGSIYEQAKNVIIWLGPRSEDSDLAMSTMSILRGVNFEDPADSAWDALETLFSRPWFSRIWVLQEFKRARNPIFQCGQALFSWNGMRVALQKLSSLDLQVGRTHVRLLGEIGKAVGMDLTREDLPADANIDPVHAAHYLVRMLRIYGGCQATEAHDKIYGLLGLSDIFCFHKANPPNIDYNRNIRDVYTDWARFLISTQNTLDLLYVSQRMLHDPSLPSWVPDWRTARHDLLLTLDVFQSVFRYRSPLRPSYDTALKFDETGRLLIVNGCVLVTFNPGFLFFEPNPKFIESKLKWVPRKDLLLECLAMGCRLKNGTLEGFAAMGIAKGRKQFWGSRGSCGLVPEATQNGDIICMLGGGDIPFVLRPIGRQYQLLGDAYIEISEDLDFQSDFDLGLSLFHKEEELDIHLGRDIGGGLDIRLQTFIIQ